MTFLFFYFMGYLIPMEIGTTHDPIFLVHKTKKAIYKIDDFPVFLLYGVPNPD